MIELKRYGVRADGNPVIETSTYIPCAPDHPLAVTLGGHDGFWVRIAVGNSLTSLGATEVSEGEYLRAVDDVRQVVERHEQEAAMAREIAAEELEAKKAQVREELAKVGLSESTIKAIVAQIRQG